MALVGAISRQTIFRPSAGAISILAESPSPEAYESSPASFSPIHSNRFTGRPSARYSTERIGSAPLRVRHPWRRHTERDAFLAGRPQIPWRPAGPHGRRGGTDRPGGRATRSVRPGPGPSPPPPSRAQQRHRDAQQHGAGGHHHDHLDQTRMQRSAFVVIVCPSILPIPPRCHRQPAGGTARRGPASGARR